ncbi:Uu.00g050560.m01.CDS01 [Anthostomella pinea]|uniref:Uu.00g050560.m01.CDS01 n=1 Tax=Anthostomella pinea TaxID=933095 RepID=A0AAI8YMI9_9PEZI|nr:Uu.00g050560.m01.CDS01 [Anthostomella pinea]
MYRYDFAPTYVFAPVFAPTTTFTHIFHVNTPHSSQAPSQPVTMASPFNQLPPIPQLLGEQNLKQWKRSIRQHAVYYDLIKFIDTHSMRPELPNQRKWEQDRVHAMAPITSTITAVEEQLEAAGWDSENEQDPKVLWDLVIATFTTIPNIHEQSAPQLFYELMDATLEDGVTLRAFNSRFNTVANRLAALDLPIPPKAKLLLMMRAIKHRQPLWNSNLERDFETGALTWENFQKQMILYANLEQDQSWKRGSLLHLQQTPRIGASPSSEQCRPLSLASGLSLGSGLSCSTP